MRSQISNPSSICILRLSAIGDVCHAVASVQAIQQRWPQAKITWVIGKVEKMLRDGLPGVEFIIFDKKAGWREYFKLRAQLSDTQFDVLLDMQVALRASGAAFCINAREKWGFDFGRAKEGQWLFTNRKIQPQSEPHVADGFLAFARAMGVADDHQLEWKMPFGEQDILWQQQQLASVGNYIVITPAASKAERNWSAKNYAAFANYAQSKGFAVVICGGPTEMEKQLAIDITRDCNEAPINLVAQTSLKQLLVVLKEAQMVLAPDTGPAHMAVTVGTPVIGLYAHSNPKRTGPYHYLDYVVSCYDQLLTEQTGKSAAQHAWGKRVKGKDLMARISVDEVLMTFDRLVADFNLTSN